MSTHQFPLSLVSLRTASQEISEKIKQYPDEQDLIIAMIRLTPALGALVLLDFADEISAVGEPPSCTSELAQSLRRRASDLVNWQELPGSGSMRRNVG